MPGDPVEAGLVTNRARPGGNITGLGGGHVVAVKRLSLLKEAVPRAPRVAALLNPRNPPHEAVLKDLKAAARSLRLQLHPVRVSWSGELESAFSTLTRGHIEALFVLGDAMFFEERKRILSLSAQRRLPTMNAWRTAVEEGGLIGYQENWPGLHRSTAAYVSKILNGTKPGDLPVGRPTKYDLYINLKTAKALGLTIPPSLLQRADQVIE